MASTESWGIEVGSGAIKAMKLGVSGDSVEVLDVAMIPHKKVLSTPDLDQADATRVALGTLMSQLDLTRASIAVSVPGHSAFARFAKLPPVDPKKVPDIVKFEAVQQIPFPIEDVEWDYQTFTSPDSPDVEVGIFAITRERIMTMLASLADVGIVPDIVTLSPIAAYNAVSYDLSFDMETPGTVIVDVGTTSTDLIISEPGRVWVRTFPIGGHHFTEALIEKFKLSYSKAERLKKEAEKSQHARHVFQAMRPVFADLAQDIQRSIGYYQSLHPDAKLVRLIGLGSTFEIPGLRRYLKQQLQMHTYRLEGFKRLTVEGPRAAELAAHAGNFATAYGLALQGLDMAALPANLMPVPAIRETVWERKLKWFGLAAGISLLAGAAMFIRPFLDSQAVAGAPRANHVLTTINEAERLKREAGEVISTSMANYDAANLIALADDNGIYANIVNDVALMLENAQEVLADWKLEGASAGKVMPQRAFVVDSLDTEYKAPASATDPAKIQVTLVVRTAHPDATRFVVESLDRWLVDNAEREGMDYKLVAGAPSWLQVAQATIGETTVGRSPSYDPGRIIRQSGRGRDGGRRTLEEINPVDNYDPSKVTITGAPQPAQPRSGERAWTSTSQSLDRLAPMPPSPGEFPIGTTVTTFSLAWTVEILPESNGGGA